MMLWRSSSEQHSQRAFCEVDEALLHGPTPSLPTGPMSLTALGRSQSRQKNPT